MENLFKFWACLLVSIPMASFAVMNGQPVTADEAQQKHIVQIAYSTDSVCTGILIGDQYILTARHCVSENVPVALNIPTKNLSSKELGSRILAENGIHLSVDKTVIHPSYLEMDLTKRFLVVSGTRLQGDIADSFEGFAFDLALIKITSDSQAKLKAAGISGLKQKDLVFDRAAIDRNEAPVVYGYGVSENFDASVNKPLRKKEILPVSKSSEQFEGRWLYSEDVGTRPGDSGGPVFSSKGVIALITGGVLLENSGPRDEAYFTHLQNAENSGFIKNTLDQFDSAYEAQCTLVTEKLLATMDLMDQDLHDIKIISDLRVQFGLYKNLCLREAPFKDKIFRRYNISSPKWDKQKKTLIEAAGGK